MDERHWADPPRLNVCSPVHAGFPPRLGNDGGTRASVVACSFPHVRIDAQDDCGEQVLTACT